MQQPFRETFTLRGSVAPFAIANGEEMGYDANKWFGNVEGATAKLVSRETTQYVANIYKYYVAYRLAWAQLQSGQQKKPGNILLDNAGDRQQKMRIFKSGTHLNDGPRYV
jgi:hypothetical protein